MKYILSLISSVLLFTLVTSGTGYAESNTDLKTEIDQKNVESYEIEVFSDTPDEEGIYEIVGHKKVNTVTNMSGDIDNIKTAMTTVEDYYDLNGNFIESIISITDFENNFINGKGISEVNSKKSNTPQTILNVTETKFIETNEKKLSTEEQKLIEKRLNFLTKEKSNFSIEKNEFDGLTKDALMDLKKRALEAQKRNLANPQYAINNYNTTLVNNTTDVNPLSLESKGAFDNYFSYNGVNGNFTAQAIGYASKHRYFKRTGTTRNNPTNNATFLKFKNNISSYEDYIVRRMELSKWTVVASWAFLVADLAVFVLGFGTGPGGWVAAITAAYSIVNLLANYTNNSYATSYRANLSKSAQQYLANAQNIIAYGNWSGGTYGSVVGY